MTIRPYTPADREGCITAFKSNMPKYFAFAELLDFENWLDEQATLSSSGHSNIAQQYYSVEQDEQVIGCGGYFIDLDKQDARMTWGLVDNVFHKQGIGRALLLHRITAIQSICPQCNIALDTSQFSYPFFQKMGFVTTKIIKDFYAAGIDRYDMELKGQDIIVIHSR